MNHPVVRFVLWFWLVTLTPSALVAAGLFVYCLAGRCVGGFEAAGPTLVLLFIIGGLWAACAWGLGLVPRRKTT